MCKRKQIAIKIDISAYTVNMDKKRKDRSKNASVNTA